LRQQPHKYFAAPNSIGSKCSVTSHTIVLTDKITGIRE
jgi:hypothetical protein